MCRAWSARNRCVKGAMRCCTRVQRGRRTREFQSETRDPESASSATKESQQSSARSAERKCATPATPCCTEQRERQRTQERTYKHTTRHTQYEYSNRHSPHLTAPQLERRQPSGSRSTTRCIAAARSSCRCVFLCFPHTCTQALRNTWMAMQNRQTTKRGAARKQVSRRKVRSRGANLAH